MLDTVFKTISRYSMLSRGERVITAVSGGPDSVCLLHILVDLQSRGGFQLSGVAHFNHKLRGVSSEGDEAFVAALAMKFGLPFFRAEAELAPGNLEQEARRVRQRFFTALIQEGKADRVALGHTRDDQSETVLLRLVRGSGPSGLAGILPVTREGLIRPLLDASRREVEAHLRTSGVEWRVDQTNLEARFLRNRVRHKLLPLLALEFNPRISESLAHLAEIACDEETWWDTEMDRLACRHLLHTEDGVELRASELTGLSPAVARRLVRKAVQLAKGDLRRLEFHHIEKVRELAARPKGMGRASLPGFFAERSFDWLRIWSLPSAKVHGIPVTVPGSYVFPRKGRYISLEVIEKKGSVAQQGGRSPCGTLEGEVCLNFVTEPLELRGWQSGDCYWPQSRNRAYKLKELLGTLGVPSWRRSGWPILVGRASAGGERILWAKEFGVAKGLEAPEGFTGPVLRIWENQESFGTSSAS